MEQLCQHLPFHPSGLRDCFETQLPHWSPRLPSWVRVHSGAVPCVSLLPPGHSSTSEQRDHAVHKQIPDLHRSPVRSFIRYVRIGGHVLGYVCGGCVLIKAQMKPHGPYHWIGPYLTTGRVKNILERGTQNKYLFINKKNVLGRGNDPLPLSTSPSLDELLNLMETQTMRVESNPGKPRTQGLLWEMRSESPHLSGGRSDWGCQKSVVKCFLAIPGHCPEYASYCSHTVGPTSKSPPTGSAARLAWVWISALSFSGHVI